MKNDETPPKPINFYSYVPTAFRNAYRPYKDPRGNSTRAVRKELGLSAYLAENSTEEDWERCKKAIRGGISSYVSSAFRNAT